MRRVVIALLVGKSQQRDVAQQLVRGFRTSHEIAKLEELTDDDLRALLAQPAGTV